MKMHNSKAGAGRDAFGLLIFGLPLMAAFILMTGCSTLFPSIFQPTYQSITVTPPAKIVFGQGEEFSYEGLQVTGVTKKGDTKDLTGDSNLTVTGYDPARPGDQTITVDYRGVTATYTVAVIGLESIAIDQAPSTARQGLDIDRSDLRVTASYGDRIAPRDVQGAEVNISGYNKDTLGAQTVTAEFYGKTATFSVTVAALTGIRITKPPAKASYFSGESLELTGLEATGTWQGAGDAPVTPEYVSGFDSSIQGNQTVIVEALGKQTTFTITVKDPSNPTTWTPAPSVFAKNIIGVVYGSGRFVAVGYDNRPEEKIIAYSTDGSAWTKAPSQATSLLPQNIIGVEYGNGTFVVAGYNNDLNNGYVSDKINESIIVYSTDGNAWTKATTPERFRNSRIFFGNGRFIAIGNYRYQQTGTSQWTISCYQVESSDGVNWSDRNPIFTGEDAWVGNSVGCVFFDGSRFIGFGRNNGQYLYSTDNGKSWRVGRETVVPISAVASGNNRLIGIGAGSVGWSNDGILWTDADQERSSGALNAVAYGFGMFVAVGDRGNIIYSRDGYTWTKVPSSTFGSASIHTVVYGNGKFVAIGDNGRIASSNKID